MATLLKGTYRLGMLPMIFIVLIMSVGSSKARISPVFSTMPKKNDNHIILHELELQIQYFQRRLIQNAGTQRVAPGGPDSQHH
ncbi:hypothetical protein I3843_11G159200 [Carya illinoinensis]|uniref:CLAVATA3/ESR (CLE)-related protein n=1 Tax=Carya illinoinensis TaxID=32201 RepID=A0A922IZY9_CARIL|nr:hypothetical protein I3760_11G158300 [Carya illinoinensis]KAG6689180.1 hypothetical protein I3842_11G161500 [Carya illinoinensis]KAG7957141.1 hypothetical protein I3843_11G159200 [Carya illinoinensis]